MTTRNKPAPVRGIAAGIAAGLIASLAMDLFQKAWAKAVPMPASSDDPATVKAAQKASRAVTGELFAKEDKAAAGQWVHYLFGAGLGGAYGLLAEYRPGVTAGFGSVLAGGALLLDEVAVPAAGLSEPPSEAPPATHAYALASHLVFGSVSEGVRRVLRS